MSDDDTTTTGDGAGAGGTAPRTGRADLRALRRAEKEAEKAARAQRRADEARERALAAARAGGLIAGEPEAEPTPEAARTVALEKPVRENRTAAESEAGGGDPATPAPAGRRPAVAPVEPPAGEARARRRRVTAALAALTVVLLALTGLATWGYLDAREQTRSEQAVTAAPREATDAAREVVTQMFTYDHRTVDADLARVRDRLTGKALTEFVDTSMPKVASAAKQQQATVFSTVAAAAPQEVTDADHVTVLVMLNRMVSTKDNPKATASASRLTVVMERVDGVWKLADLKTL